MINNVLTYPRYIA